MNVLRRSSLSALWLIITLALLGLIISIDIGHVRENLDSESSFVYESLYEKAYINEILLQNFAVLVRATPDDYEQIRRFSSQIRTRYPHIERFQIQHRVSRNQLSDFAAQMSTTVPDLRIRPDNGGTANDTLYPITFIDPMLPGTRHLLGQDLSAEARFRNAMTFANQYRQPVASDPFQLSDQQSAYALFLAIFMPYQMNTAESPYMASVVVRIANLLPDTAQLHDQTEVLLRDDHGRILDRRISRQPAPGLLWPELNKSRTINRFGQSFQIELVRHVTPSDLSWTLFLVVLLGSASGFWLLRAYLHQQLELKGERENTLRKLQHERLQLEQRVHQRTEALNAQLMENQRLAHKVLEIQELERRHLAHELHDELGQSLTAIRTDAKLLKRLHPDEDSPVNNMADSIDTIAQHIYDVTINMMRALRPSSLDELGLIDALHECINAHHFHNEGIEVETNFSGALNELGENYNITLYRLVQEALNNVHRHAEAQRIVIHLHRQFDTDKDEELISFSIQDDGRGFAPHERNEHDSFGLIGMRERVNALGGSFKIISEHGQGTRIHVRIPLHEEEQEWQEQVPLL